MNKARTRLILLTIFIIFIGSVVAVVIYLDRSSGSAGCVNQVCECDAGCNCVEGSLVCSISETTSDNVSDQKIVSPPPIIDPIDESKFDFMGMVFRSSYLTDNIDNEFDDSPAGVILDEVDYSGTQITVDLREKTICNDDEEPKLHEGLYYLEGNNLVLSSNLVNDGLDYPIECVAELSYDISGIEIGDFSEFRLFYQNDAGTIEEFKICPYSDEIYVDGDAFQAADNCNACSCDAGVTNCSTEKKCLEQVSGDSAYSGRPDYEMFELPEEENECENDKQCFATGCQDEVCSPVNGVVTDCGVALSKIDNVSCGCVNKKCIWR